MSRPHPLLAVMLVVVRVTATHPTVPHLTVVSETVVKEGPSIVIHPLVLQLMEPVTGTGQSSCKEALEPVCSAVWSNPAVIPDRVGFVRLSQIGVFVDSINKIRGCKTKGCDGNLVPVAVKSTGLGGGLSVCIGCFTRYENEPANSTEVQNPRRNSYASTGCRHYTMHCLTLNCILRMRVQVPRCPSRPLPVSRLFHAGCTSS